MTCRRGDLALVPFPFTNLSASKRRPVLCLTDPDGFGDFLGVAMTSRPHHVNALALPDEELADGRLPVPSWVRTDRVVTLNVALVTKTFGSVTDRFTALVVAALCERIGLTEPTRPTADPSVDS